MLEQYWKIDFRKVIAQSTNSILMIRPAKFSFNDETAVNNFYQHNLVNEKLVTLHERALKEFDDFVIKLTSNGVEVIVIDDTEDFETPDSIFPNNWVSFHEDGQVVLYPMFAKNRRRERRLDIFDQLKISNGFNISNIVDWTESENQYQFLEGTGSLVLDRNNKIAYAALSERTDEEIVEKFCNYFNYQAVMFIASQTVEDERLPIYHTNVMMCVADNFVVICLDAIDDINERQELIEKFEDCEKEIIEITEDQKKQFAGNMLQVKTDNGNILVMSSAAYKSLDEHQISQIENYCSIIHSPLDTIEQIGGGSARCMMAEVFLPKK